MPEIVKPMDIEKRSFEIITELLGDRQPAPEIAPVVKRVIHTTADFDYAENLVFSPGAVERRAVSRCRPPRGPPAGGGAFLVVAIMPRYHLLFLSTEPSA